VSAALESGARIAGERSVTADACVIGTGAGGAPVAALLAEAGMRVAILEEGALHEPASMTARPRDMMARLYRDGGQIATVGNPPIVLPLGRGIGGTTLVNSGTCFRTPQSVLDRWRADYGLELDLREEFALVEEAIGVHEVPPELAGRNANLVKEGADRLGVSAGYLKRNARGCVGSGVCAFGCPTGAKQHAGQVWIPRAQQAGAMTFTEAKAQRIVVEGGRVREVLARTAGGGTIRIRAETVIVAAGALLTPLLLRRNGLGTASGHLGRNLSIHPASAARALYDEVIDPWAGVPQSVYVDELAADGIMLEGIAGPPDQAAMSTPRSGAEHRELMLAARRTGSFGVMVSDTARGTVRSIGRRLVVRYDLDPSDAERFRRGFELLARIFFAAGAREVIVPVDGVPTLRDGDVEPLRRAKVRPRQISAMAFHPLGTARAGADPSASVVDPHLRVHGVGGLHVADGSVVPSSLGVNPQITIMALAARLAGRLSGGRSG
jgi:choline dehydrogenase-like flavoprotein